MDELPLHPVQREVVESGRTMAGLVHGVLLGLVAWALIAVGLVLLLP